MAKLCVYWQGRKGTGSGARKHSVFRKCMPETRLSHAVNTVKSISVKRGSAGCDIPTEVFHGGAQRRAG